VTILQLAVSLPYPFERRYLQLALIAAVAVGVSAPLVGAFLVERRMSMLGDGIGHLAFAGVAAGLLLNVWPVWTALAAAVLGALIMEYLRSSGRAQGDLALAVLLYGGIGLGLVLAGAAGSYNASVLSYLFGSILTVNDGEVLTIVGLGAIVAVVVIANWRRLLLVVTDPDFARTVPVNVRLVDLSLAVGASMVIVAAMRVVGLLLVASMMVLPVGAARQLANSFRMSLALGSVFGATAAIGGLWVARVADWPPGATIVVVSTGLVVVASAIARLRR
jgi:zinc transport system permease protein